MDKTFYLCTRIERNARLLAKKIFAEIAQLVEHNLAKVGVAGPSPVFRSFFEMLKCPGGGIGRRARFRCVCFTTCRFESCLGHGIQNLLNVGEVAELVDALL